jgi:hypothetical protein
MEFVELLASTVYYNQFNYLYIIFAPGGFGNISSASMSLAVQRVLAQLYRGGTDILIACVDGLTGFKEVIHAVFPKARIQVLWESPGSPPDVGVRIQ